MVNNSRGALAFAGSVAQANRAARFADDTVAALSRGAHAQAQTSFSQATAAWSSSDDLLNLSVGYYGKAQHFASSRFVESATGKALQGAGAGGTGNVLQYTMPNTDNFQVRKDWNVGDAVFAGGVGMGTGVSTVAIPGLIPGDSKVADIAEFSLSRGTEFFAGGINNSVTTEAYS